MSDFSTPAGWYPDGDGWERRWDGSGWTEERRRMAEPTQVRPSSPPPSSPPSSSRSNSPSSPPPAGPPTAAPPNWAPQGSTPPSVPPASYPQQASYGHVPSTGLGGPVTPSTPTPFGAPLPVAGGYRPPSGPPKKSRLWLWLTLGLVVVLLAGTAITLAVVQPWKDDDKGKDDDEPTAGIQGDIDGDGLGDVVYRLSLDYDNVKIITAISDGEKFETSELAINSDGDYGDLHVDWDSDGVNEALTWDFVASGNQITLSSADKDFPGSQTFTLSLSSLKEYGGPKVQLLAGDFDGDGDQDIAVAGPNDKTVDVSVLLNDGEGTFEDPVLWLAIPNATSETTTLRAGDFDGDGDADLWAQLPAEKLDDEDYTDYYSGSRGVAILTSSGDRFEQGAVSSVRAYQDSFLVGDVTGDGTVNLIGVEASSYDEELTVTVYDLSDGQMEEVSGFTGTTDIGDRSLLSATLSDVDGDGKADVVFAVKAYDETEITGIQVMKSTGAVFDDATVWAETSGCLERSCRIQFEGQPRY